MNSETRPSQPARVPRKWLPSGADKAQAAAMIEAEARTYVESGFTLTESSMREAGRFDLVNAIRRHYPGRMRSLREQLSLAPINRKPHGYWQGEEGLENIRRETSEVLAKEGKLTMSVLNKLGRNDLTNAIRSYPGGLNQLKRELGLMPVQRPTGYWTIENIVLEARKHFSQHGRITPNGVDGGLRFAIAHNYPGGWKQMRKDLGMEIYRGDNNYWTKERVFERAKQFLEEHGKLSGALMQKTGNSSLSIYIPRLYPGGWSQLRQDLGLKVLIKKWSESEIMDEAKKVLSEGGLLTKTWLADNGYSGLAAAIDQKYPGRMKGLRQELKVDFERKPQGYWTIENIEKEALSYYGQHESLSISSLYRDGQSSLAQMITKKYPGGQVGLRNKLGIPEPSSDDHISSDMANEQLKGLLGGRYE